MSSQLPPNATPIELALEDTMRAHFGAPVDIDDLWNPATIPAPLLPWLAWALSVDVWDSAWDEARKRAVVAASIQTHRVKGTIGALKRAIAAFDRGIEIAEWFDYGGAPFHFKAVIDVTGTPFTLAEMTSIFETIEAAKNARSKLETLSLSLSNPATIKNAVGITAGITITLGAAA
jgi:phage tail P2-like protein